MTNSIDLAISVDCEAWEKALADVLAITEKATQAALESVELPEGPVEVSVLLSDDKTVQDLNKRYRDQDKPTNVLSFAALDSDDEGFRPEGEPLLLGDVIIACETTQKEAEDQKKSLRDHLCHLTVHGVLHLLGYDHHDDNEAAKMESLETDILKGLGIADPYA